MKLSALAAVIALLSDSIFTVPLTLQTYNPQEKGIFAVNSTLVSGPYEAVLFDAQFSVEDGEKLVDMTKKNSKPFTRIVITSGDPDPHLGLGPLMEASPQAGVVATSETVKHIEAIRVVKLAYWGPQMKDGAPTQVYVPQVLKVSSFTIDSEKVTIMQSYDHAVFARIRANKTILGGTGVAWGMHLWAADTQIPASRQQWCHTLDQMAAPHPQRVIPGHCLGIPPEGDSAVRFTKTYLQQFEQALKTHQDLAGVIRATEMQWLGPAEISSLELSAKANTGEMKWWSRLCVREIVLNLTCEGCYCPENGLPQLRSHRKRAADFGLHLIRSPPGLSLKPEQDKGVRIRSNRQARHFLGLDYRLSQQKKVVLEGDEETTLNHIHATDRRRRGG